MKRIAPLVLAAALLAGAGTGCYGSFSASKKLHAWNGKVSSNVVVREAVFLGLVIIPVYELAVIGDAIIFNTIEFATGSNPFQ